MAIYSTSPANWKQGLGLGISPGCTHPGRGALVLEAQREGFSFIIWVGVLISLVPPNVNPTNIKRKNIGPNYGQASFAHIRAGWRLSLKGGIQEIIDKPISHTAFIEQNHGGGGGGTGAVFCKQVWLQKQEPSSWKAVKEIILEHLEKSN